jgi:hypothetical protein
VATRTGRAKAQGRGGIIPIVLALGVALAVLATPVGLIEMLVASSGLSESIPAAAPPLGLKARLVLAGFAGLMAAGAGAWLRRAPDEKDGRHDRPAIEEEGRRKDAVGAKTMGFAFSKLTALARGRAAPPIAPDAPSLRRADAHPDAPPRPPIFASRDFDGLEIFARPGTGRRSLVSDASAEPRSDAQAVPVETPPPGPAFLRPAASFAVPTDMAEEEDQPESLWAEPLWDEPVAPPPPDAAFEPAPPLTPLPLRLPTHGLSVQQLTERLERGLALRTRAAPPAPAPNGVLADMPVAAPVAVRPTVARDTDEALREALGTLRAMSGRR